MTPAQTYLHEIIDYGGEPCTRAEAILDMQRQGAPQPCIDRWLQGNDLARRLRERISVRLFAGDRSGTRPSDHPSRGEAPLLTNNSL